MSGPKYEIDSSASDDRTKDADSAAGARLEIGELEYVASTEHHGPYVTTVFGTTVADFYTMSNPRDWAVCNGGTSKPIHHMGNLADDYAAEIVHRVNCYTDMYEALKALLPIAMGSEAYAFSAQGSGKAVEAAEAALKKAEGR